MRRRGKYLIVDLEGDRHLVMHLRMTGNLLIAGSERFGAPRLYESEPDARFLRAVLELDDGSELWFTDARRFGHAVVLSGEELEPYLAARLGIEPLGGELTGETLAQLAAGRTAPLKSFLLDQRRVAGVGNIYADEALWRAELHPLSPAGSMRASIARRWSRGSWRRSRPGSRTGARPSTTIATRGGAGLDAGRVPRAHARGPGLPSVWR